MSKESLICLYELNLLTTIKIADKLFQPLIAIDMFVTGSIDERKSKLGSYHNYEPTPLIL